jgi:glyoxylase-like metal-dependent hydrolase (beta-lactamase superfamily II)
MTQCPLSPGVSYFDLRFQDTPAVIATAVLEGRDGVALIDPGPASCLGTLTKALADMGVASGDVRAILLTHIHLDHAGATGALVEMCPSAEVHVHERGARHLIDPSKLLASASRLYGDDMDRLWGDVKPVPAERVRTASPVFSARIGEERPATFSVVGHELAVAYTPGHAQHHVSYFLPSARIAFVGDTAGICRPGARFVLPPTPPPDIDLDAWRASTERILAWHPDTLFLTHFGAQPSPATHMQELWRRIDDWTRRVQASLDQPGTDEERAARFAEDVTTDLKRLTSADEARAYARAGRFDFSWSGLARWIRGRTPS